MVRSQRLGKVACPLELGFVFWPERGCRKKRDRGCCDCACGSSNTDIHAWADADWQKLAVYGATLTRGMANTTATVGERDHNGVPKEGGYRRGGRRRGGSTLTDVNRGPALTFCGPIPVVGGRQCAPPRAWRCLLAVSGDTQRKESEAAVTMPMAAVTQIPTRGLMLISRNR